MKYKFLYRSDDGKAYYWYASRGPDDSRVEVIRCGVEWFWGTANKKEKV
jgi:hypothetical protein